MSTENNIDQLFKDSVKILTDLIAFKTVSGEDNNSLINPIVKKRTKDVNPKVTPSICGIVLTIPKLNPE